MLRQGRGGRPGLPIPVVYVDVKQHSTRRQNVSLRKLRGENSEEENRRAKTHRQLLERGLGVGTWVRVGVGLGGVGWGWMRWGGVAIETCRLHNGTFPHLIGPEAALIGVCGTHQSAGDDDKDVPEFSPAPAPVRPCLTPDPSLQLPPPHPTHTPAPDDYRASVARGSGPCWAPVGPVVCRAFQPHPPDSMPSSVKRAGARGAQTTPPRRSCWDGGRGGGLRGRGKGVCAWLGGGGGEGGLRVYSDGSTVAGDSSVPAPRSHTSPAASKTTSS